MSERPISFYEFLRNRNYSDSDARGIIARHNSFKDRTADKPVIKAYSKYLKTFK